MKRIQHLNITPWIFSASILLAPLAIAADDKADAEKSDKAENSQPAATNYETVTKAADITIDGKKVSYEVSAGKLTLNDDKGKLKASIFHTSYIRTNIDNTIDRPVMFAFNGGPGSSSVWLHIGMLGPRVLNVTGDGTKPQKPPVRMKDNPFSILDECDLVFIDPVSTGYSRTEKDGKSSDFHGLNADIESVGEFIRKWITKHDRWASPKYLLGESYGGIRAAGLSDHLQSRFGMSLNGVVLLSSLLDFRTLQAAQGSDLVYSVFLPAFTTTAHYHNAIQGDRDDLLKQATEFAYGDYANALTQGNALSPQARKTIAAKLEDLTSIDQDTWLKHNLRLHASVFRSKLLDGKSLGRFDSRVAWNTADKSSSYATYDPSYSLALGAFSTAMLDYLGREIGYKEDQHYEILTSKVHPWNWNSNNRHVNVADRLATALRDNPELKVLVMSGHTDLATPPESVAYSVRHMLDLPKSTRENINTVFYEGGHMFYLNPADLKKSRQDLLKFLKP